MKVLVIGSTGQLGYTITKMLTESPHEVFAFHRSTSETKALQNLPDVILVEGDLLDLKSLERAIKGIDVVISTANSAIPSQKTDAIKKDTLGHLNLIQACKKTGIRQLIFTSLVPFGKWDQKIPLVRSKRRIEDEIRDSGIPYTIFQPSNFMDVHFALMGTELPLKDTDVATLRRPFKFANTFYNGMRRDMEEKGRINLVGKGDCLCSYITVENVAEFHIKAIDNPSAINQTFQVGGPEELTALEVKELFEEAFGKELKVKSTPPAVLNLMSKLMAPFNREASNLLAMNYVCAHCGAPVHQSREVAKLFGVQLTSARDFIRQKMGKASTLAEVSHR